MEEIATRVTSFALKGLLGAQAPHGPDRARDRARRRDGQRHVRAHRLDRQGVRLDLHRRLPRAPTRRSPASPPFDLGGRPGTTERRRSTSRCSPKVKALPDVAGRDRRRRRRERAARSAGRQGDRLRRRAEPRLQRRPDASRSSTRSRSSRAHWPGDERGRGRQVDRRQEGPRRSAARSASRPRAPSSSCGSPGSSSSARWARSAAPRSPASTCRPRSGSSTRRASSTRSASRRSRASRPTAARLARSARSCRRTRRCAPATRRRSEDATDTDEFISFLQYFLLAFGVIALFVGAFVIANSLSITIAQRTREFATLRTLGASRRQVLGSVVLEALVMGVARLGRRALPRPRAREGALRALRRGRLHAAEQRAPASRRARSSSRSLVGILVTLIASFFPALRATRVPPIAAVREGATLPPGRFARFRTPFAALLTALGFALLVFGLFAHGTLDACCSC